MSREPPRSTTCCLARPTQRSSWHQWPSCRRIGRSGPNCSGLAIGASASSWWRGLVGWPSIRARAGRRCLASTALAPLWARAVQASIGSRLGRYVFEPHAAILAAGLVDVLAAEHGLSRLGPDAVYLTGDRCLADAALDCFEVREVLPLDIKRLRALVRDRRIGQLEVKTRGVPHDPAVIARRLRPSGPHRATLLLTRLHGKPLALLARREQGSAAGS